MSFWGSLVLVLLGVLVVLMPFGAIGVSASKLSLNERREFFTLYAALLVLLAIVGADELAQWPHRLPVDLVLLVGGLALGAVARPFLTALWASRRGETRP